MNLFNFIFGMELGQAAYNAVATPGEGSPSSPELFKYGLIASVTKSPIGLVLADAIAQQDAATDAPPPPPPVKSSGPTGGTAAAKAGLPAPSQLAAGSSGRTPGQQLQRAVGQLQEHINSFAKRALEDIDESARHAANEEVQRISKSMEQIIASLEKEEPSTHPPRPTRRPGNKTKIVE